MIEWTARVRLWADHPLPGFARHERTSHQLEPQVLFILSSADMALKRAADAVASQLHLDALRAEESESLPSSLSESERKNYLTVPTSGTYSF